MKFLTKIKSIVVGILISVNMLAATLPTNPHNSGWYIETTESKSILKTSYNLWDLSYSTGNPNNDYIWIFPINDRIYNGGFYTGDEIHYDSGNPSDFYTLYNTDLDDYLTYDVLDADGTNVVEYDEMRYRVNYFFEEGQTLPLHDGFGILLGCGLLFGIILIYREKGKKDEEK